MSAFIRVVVADDSPFICKLLTQYLESDPAICVIKTVYNGKDAVEYVKKLKPDVVTLDLNMPVLGGIDALRQIMEESPAAVVLITGVSKEAARLTEQGISMGAVDFIFKYSSETAVPPDLLRREIIAKVKAAAKIKVIRSIPSLKMRKGILNSMFSTPRSQAPAWERGKDLEREKCKIDAQAYKFYLHVAVVGASTGGPLALKDLLSALQKGFSFPLVIVQHMPEKFTKILADQLNYIFPFPVREARQGEALLPGKVFIAPGDRHLVIRPDRTVQLSLMPPVNGHRPSIDVTMQSAAHVFGNYAAGVLLSGMGNDGTQGMLAIKNNRGLTFAQSAETCVIDTMPASAIKKNLIQSVGSPQEIGHWLVGC